MVQPISSSLVARAAAGYLKPVENKTTPSGAEGRNASPLLDNMSGPAFVIELSNAAQRHIGSTSGDGARKYVQRSGGGQGSGKVGDDFSIDELRETSSGDQIETDGSGRREAPLMKPNGPVIYKPAGSIIDVRI